MKRWPMRAARSRAQWRLAALAMSGAVALGAACTTADGTDGDSTRAPTRGAQLGAIAPGLASRTLDGEPVSLDALRGSPVLLNVWATWCHPCRDEIPVLEALHREHAPHGLQLVGVSIDDAGRTSDIRRFASEFGVTYTIWHDPDQRVMPSFSVIGVPTTFLIGRDGRLLWRKT
ncbi:MAG: TlpA family protein disulfide reductase, partial [Gemmatimonadaceae bacterium]|nr:TlpA family protein disulfide reductase [Gemmatimonadaceae bacterium]